MTTPPAAQRGRGLLRIVVAIAIVALVAGAAIAVAARQQPVPVPGPVASAALPSPSSSDLYVAPGGSDTSAGSASAPLATIQAAVDRVPPGATVWVQPGTYAGFELHRSGQPGAPITVAGARSGAATIQAVSGTAAIDVVDATSIRLLDLVVVGSSTQFGDGIRIDHGQGIDIEGTSIQGTRAGFGLEARYSSDIEIRGDDFDHNAVGIRLYGEGDPAAVHDVVIEANRIHDNDSMVVNDPEPNNDFGANAIIWHKVTGTTIARDNQIWNSRAQSHDYGEDGGAFEIWGSSNLTITGNTVWDNLNVMETGSDGPTCSNITFERNVAFATAFGVGMILRCASDSVVANNTFVDLRQWAFDLSDRSGGNPFAQSVDGLRILDNIVVGSPLYAIENGLPSDVGADHNLVWQPDGPVAKLPHGNDVGNLAGVTAATGLDAHSIDADPLFANPAAHDYRLLAGSPALDRGVSTGPGDSVQGSAPDLGAFEGAVPTPGAS